MFEEIIQPQFSDSDLFGHANYLAVARWFERGRSPLYLALAPKLSPDALGIVIIKTELFYHKEVFIDQTVLIKTFVSKIGTKSFATDQEAYQNGELCAQSTTVFCGFDPTTHSSVPLSEEKRNILKSHLAETMKKTEMPEQ